MVVDVVVAGIPGADPDADGVDAAGGCFFVIGPMDAKEVLPSVITGTELGLDPGTAAVLEVKVGADIDVPDAAPEATRTSSDLAIECPDNTLSPG